MASIHALITGGSGYVGRRLVEMALARGWRVTLLGRDMGGGGPGLRVVPWRLGEPVSEAAFADDGEGCPSVLIHLAHAWNDLDQDGANQSGSRLLFEAARSHGLSIVFCSSASARDDALNAYGRTKRAIERMLDRPGEKSARVGLIYGGPSRGQWGMLLAVAGLSPVIPMVAPDTAVQPIHLDEVCDGLLNLAENRNLEGGVYGLAANRPISFGTFLRTIAAVRHGRRLRIMPIPLGIALAGARMAALLPPFRGIPERILGLGGIPVIETHLKELGLELRHLESGLEPEARFRRRALLKEGRRLMSYVLGRSVALLACRRYAVVLAGHRPLPSAWALRLREPVAGDGELAHRLRLATLLAEATPGAAATFYDYEGIGKLAVLWGVVRIMAIEAVCLPIRLLFRSR